MRKVRIPRRKNSQRALGLLRRVAKLEREAQKETVANTTARFLGIYFRMKPQSPNA